MNKFALVDPPGIKMPGVNTVLSDPPGIQQPNWVQKAPLQSTNAKPEVVEMQNKLVQLSNMLTSGSIAKVVDIDNSIIAAVGFVGNTKNPHKADGGWGNNTNKAVIAAKTIYEKVISYIKANNIPSNPNSESVFATIGTAIQTKDANEVSKFLNDMIEQLPKLQTGLASYIADSDNAKLTELINGQVKIFDLPVRGKGNIPITFADIADRQGFDSWLNSHGLPNDPRILKEISYRLSQLKVSQ